MFKSTTWLDGEKKVQEYMRRRGYKILYINFSCVGVELDIVAMLSKKQQKKKLTQEYKLKMIENKSQKSIYKKSLKSLLKTIEDLLVVTEVKSRDSDKYGIGSEAVSDAKKHHMIRGARFLQKEKRFSKMQIRFDVASVDGGKINYIENAF